MIGDIVIWIRGLFGKNSCLHEYEEKIANIAPPQFYKVCKKCGRVK